MCADRSVADWETMECVCADRFVADSELMVCVADSIEAASVVESAASEKAFAEPAFVD